MFVQENTGDALIVATEQVKEPGPTAVAIQAATLAATAMKDPSGAPVKVRVIAPYRVSHDGKAYVGGDAVTVPAEIADHWLKNKWVQLVPARSKPASQKGES